MDPDEFRRRQDARVLAHWQATKGARPAQPAPRPPSDTELAALQQAATKRAVEIWDPNEAPDCYLGGGLQSLAAATAEGLEATLDDWVGRSTNAPYLGGHSGEAYAEYYRSAHWRATRERMILRSGGFCQRCHNRFERRALDVHHLNYRHLWAEPDRDLEVLCRTCHAAKPRRLF